LPAHLACRRRRKGSPDQDVDIRRSIDRPVALFRAGWFLIGWIAAVLASLLHVGALALAPLSLGQAVVSSGRRWP
jgi:hypothetical protein